MFSSSQSRQGGFKRSQLSHVILSKFLDSSWVAGTNAKAATSIDKQEFDSTPTPFYKIMQRLFPVILRLAVSQVRHEVSGLRNASTQYS